jgi:hypothetical protein
VAALSVHVRPGAIALPALMAGAATIIHTGSWRRCLIRASSAAALTVLVLLPWALRNHYVLGQFVWTTTNGGFTLYDGFNSSATGASDQRFVADMAPQLREMSEIERSRHLASLAGRFAWDHPGRAIELAIRKLARTWSPVPLSSEYGSDRRIVVVALLYTVPLFALALAGLWASRRLSRSAKVFLLLPAIYFSFAHALSVGSLRYRLPADVPMAVLAASVVKRPEDRG